MAEETVITEVPIGEASFKEFKAARAKGEGTVKQEAAPVVEETEKVDEVEETEEEKSEKRKSRGGFQARIDRLTKHTATLEEQLATEKKAREAAEAKTNGKGAEETKPDPNAEPLREQFETEAAYIRALTRWEVKQELKQEREQQEQEAQAAKQKELITSYNEKAIEEQSKHEDWKEVMSQSISIPSVVGDAIVFAMKNGPAVAYYLGKHPEVCEQMMEVHPLAATDMAWDISKELAKEDGEEEPAEKAAEPEKPKTRAPAPIKPVTGGTTRSTIPLDKADFQAYKKLRASGRVQ